MTSIRFRENTFKVDLSNFDKRPSFEEIHAFVNETIGLKQDKVIRLQMNHAQNCAHIRCVDFNTAFDAVEQHDEKHELTVNGKKHKVRLMMDDGGVEIKIHDLSENVSNDEIQTFLAHYGEVLAIKELMWGEKFAFKGIPSGIRVVKMKLTKHIRSFVTIQGEQTLLTYKNQPQTCRHCTNLVHPGISCVQNKKLSGQKVDLDKRLKESQKQNLGNRTSTKQTYADVLDSGANPLMPRFAVNDTNKCTGQINLVSDEVNNSRSVSPVPPASSNAATTSADEILPKQSVSNNMLPADENMMDVNEGPNINTTSSTEVRNFKIPIIPLNPIDISEYESGESSADNCVDSQKVKRGRGRAKKIKLVDSLREVSPLSKK